MTRVIDLQTVAPVRRGRHSDATGASHGRNTGPSYMKSYIEVSPNPHFSNGMSASGL